MEIIRLDKCSPPQQFQDVARIHEAELQAGTLARLGIAFLADFYRYFVSDPDCVLFAAIHNDKIVGFVSGSCDIKKFYRRFMIRRGLFLARFLIPYLARRRSFSAVASFRSYLSSDAAVDLPASELTSLAVDVSVQRSGIGKALFAALQEYFKQREIVTFKVTAADTQTSALGFYPAVGGKLAANTRLGELKSYVFVCSTHAGTDQPTRPRVPL